VTKNIRLVPDVNSFYLRSFIPRLLRAFFVVAGLTLPSLFAQPNVQGQWSPLMTWPFKPVHTHVLPTGKVMFWDSFELGDNSRLWDPVTNTLTALPQAGVNIFCTGHSFLRDGRLLVTGGHIANFVGLRDTLTFDPFDNTWTRVADMNAGRWYPTNTTLPNGDVLVLSGQIDTTVGMNVLPQVFQAESSTWRDLSAAQLAVPFYPFMYVAPNGKVFMAGPDQQTMYLDTSGTGLWTPVGNTNFGTRNWGSSVMYDDGKILLVGGTLCGAYAECAPTETAEIIDLNAPIPQWTYVASMAHPRKHHNATLLPDGKVLVTGGSQGTEDPNATTVVPVNAVELWDPATNVWTPMADLVTYRGYHATAVLLPDGRVLSGGGEIGVSSAEIYSPPYLFNGPRPAITSAPSIVEYGRGFFVETPDAAGITKVTLISLSSVTHSFNATQRISRLTFSQASGGLNITAPANPNLAPPGYYMLFLLNAAGVPSIAKILRVDNVPTTVPAAPTALVATAAGTQINLTWTDNANNESGFRIERSTFGPSGPFTTNVTVGADVTMYADSTVATGTTYYYRVRAMNGAGASGWSNTANATITSGTPPAPTALTATALSSTQINISWTDNADNETGFSIERSPDGQAATFAPLTTVGPNATTYTDPGLTAATIYFYRVRATGEDGNSGYTNTVSATTLAASTLPAVPTGLTATAASSTQINLTWADNASDETGFQIERSPTGAVSTFSLIDTVGPNMTTYANTGLTGGTTHHYRVRALGANGNSDYSNTASATTPFIVDVQAPAAPTRLTATVVTKRLISLTWTDNSTNETGFAIEQSLDGVRFTQLATVRANVRIHLIKVEPSTTYHYRVRATGARGNSPYSNIVIATTPKNNGKND
jgi:fibronectin type 3 domain-containing protein